MSQTDSTEKSYTLLGTGTWLDSLPRLPRPVIAIGSTSLYRVLVHGSGFAFCLEGDDSPIVGFYTVRFVAAKNMLEAEAQAQSIVLHDWRKKGLEARAGLPPVLRAEESEALSSIFRLRSAEGFVFYSASEEPSLDQESSAPVQKRDA